MIQKFTTYETTVSKTIDKGNHLLADSESLRLSKDDKIRLGNYVKSLKTKWEELQEAAFDTERRYGISAEKTKLEIRAWYEVFSFSTNHRKSIISNCKTWGGGGDKPKSVWEVLQGFSYYYLKSLSDYSIIIIKVIIDNDFEIVSKYYLVFFIFYPLFS